MVNSYDSCYLFYLFLIKNYLAPQSEALSAEVVVLNEVRHHFIDRRNNKETRYILSVNGPTAETI